jgi:eukaryotic-like serine/threonine-protein kinase
VSLPGLRAVTDSLAHLKMALADRYAVVREIGRGGMATVYLARDLKHPRQVALKVLRPEVAGALGADRFLKEIELAARLQHPHILGLLDSGTAGDVLYYVMPYVEGESLRHRLDRESQLQVDVAVTIAREVAGALEYAHRHGVVHRDIKPENILLSAGQALVADFGIAKAFDAAGGEKLTETGLALGTPHYMSPEQASATRSLDGRADLYALGCVLYEMLAGSPPFTGPSAQSILARHSVDPVPSLHTVRGTVPAGIEWAITKAMAKVPADRFASAGEFADALAHPEHAPAQKARDRRWLYAGLAVAVLALVFGLGGHRIFGGTAGGAPLVKSLAVLPLETVSGDSALGDAMSEALITDLGRISSLRVISRTGVMRFKGTTKSAPEVARTLGVDAVLQGGIQRSGESLRVDLRLISAASGHRLWAQRFDQQFNNRSSLGHAVSQSLVAALKLSVTPSEEHQLHAPPTTNAEAYDDFLRGKIHDLRNNRRDDSIAIDVLKHAVALDPNFAAAYAELAYAYGQWTFLFAPRDTATLEKGLVTVERALRLDPDLGEAHFARGFLLWSPASHYPHELAIREYRRAIALNPNLAEAHRWLGVVYWHIGLFDKAIEEFRETETVDPGNRHAQTALAHVLTYQGRYEEALRTTREVPREWNPPMRTYNIAWDLVYLGRSEEASTIIEDYLKTTPQDPGGLVTGVRAILHAKTGDARRAEEDIQKAVALGEGYGHFHHTAYNIASAYALLHRPALAVRWLRRAVDDGLPCYPLFEKDPNLDNLRQDPGFVALMPELKSQWERWGREL